MVEVFESTRKGGVLSMIAHHQLSYRLSAIIIQIFYQAFQIFKDTGRRDWTPHLPWRSFADEFRFGLFCINDQRRLAQDL